MSYDNTRKNTDLPVCDPRAPLTIGCRGDCSISKMPELKAGETLSRRKAQALRVAPQAESLEYNERVLPEAGFLCVSEIEFDFTRHAVLDVEFFHVSSGV